MYVALAWLVYAVFGSLALRLLNPGMSLSDALGAVALAGVFLYLFGGAGGLALAAHGRETPPSELRLASAIVATTLALLAFIALLAAPNC